MTWADMAELPSDEDDFDDFEEGLFTKSFTPSNLITGNLPGDKGHMADIHFDSHPERAVNYNMILTLSVEFKAQQDQVFEVEKVLWNIISEKPVAIKLEDNTSKEEELRTNMKEDKGKIIFDKPSRNMT